MKYVILHVLCEGQTEEKFVKAVLSPYLHQFNIFPKPVLLVTSKKKGAAGGMLNYGQVKHDLILLMKQYRNTANEAHLFTTMFDYYALPGDFPGFDQSKGIRDVRNRISSMEIAFQNDIGNDSFIPYIQLHEFEALLFTDISKLEKYYPHSKSDIAKLKEETDLYGDPEMINDGLATAPSKRVIKALENQYNYNKVQSGSAVASDIGIGSIINRCRHFGEWIDKIYTYALNC